jgi:hypothetical protein
MRRPPRTTRSGCRETSTTRIVQVNFPPSYPWVSVPGVATLGSIRLSTAGAVLISAVAASLAGCTASGDGDRAVTVHVSGGAVHIGPSDFTPDPGRSAEPQSREAVSAAVDRIEAANARRDGGARWDMFGLRAQVTMSRADYTAVTDACPSLLAVRQALSIALDPAATVATVTSRTGRDGTVTWTMMYENARWRQEPSAAELGWMALGVEGALAKLRAAGTC